MDRDLVLAINELKAAKQEHSTRLSAQGMESVCSPSMTTAYWQQATR